MRQQVFKKFKKKNLLAPKSCQKFDMSNTSLFNLDRQSRDVYEKNC